MLLCKVYREKLHWCMYHVILLDKACKQLVHGISFIIMQRPTFVPRTMKGESTSQLSTTNNSSQSIHSSAFFYVDCHAPHTWQYRHTKVVGPGSPKAHAHTGSKAAACHCAPSKAEHGIDAKDPLLHSICYTVFGSACSLPPA